LRLKRYLQAWHRKLPVSDSSAVSFDNIEDLAVVVCQTGADQLHVGLIYIRDEVTPVLCHLAWHYRLMFEDPVVRPTWSESNLHWCEVNLDRINRRVIAGWLEDLKTNPNEIPYGFDIQPPVFTAEGQYIVQPDGKGLTCATFIVEVYRANALPLLDDDAWPSRLEEDTAWQERILDGLRKTGAEQSHIDALSDDIGCVRYKPEEVAAATLQEDRPVSFDECLAMAQEIRGIVLASTNP